MSPNDRHRQLYEYEIACNRKMLEMIESVPDAGRSDPRFQQAVRYAAHLAACRENWLDFMFGDGDKQVEWFEEPYGLTTLKPRFAAIEAQWTAVLANLTDEAREGTFEFSESGGTWSLPTEVQLLQLSLHAPYHRGQIALLVEQLGGETVDTDFVYWAMGEFC